MVKRVRASSKESVGLRPIFWTFRRWKMLFSTLHTYTIARPWFLFITSDYQKMRRVNIEGTTNIVNLCISHRVKKLCYVSSVAAIENRAEGEVTSESDHWTNTGGKSGYAITKYGAEMEVWRASQEEIPVVIVNPGVILGSGPWHKGSGTLFRRVDEGLPFYTTGVTGFVDVQDVVRIMISLMEGSIQNERFVVVSENLTYRDVLYKIAESLKKENRASKLTDG